MKTISLLACLMASSLIFKGQQQISGRIEEKSPTEKMLYLQMVRYATDPGILIDSISVAANGKFEYSVPGSFAPGTLFKISSSTPGNVFAFPENALLFIYDAKSSLDVLVKSFAHLYLFECTAGSSANLAISKLQKSQQSFFTIADNFLKSKRGPNEKDVLAEDITRFRSDYIQELQRFSKHGNTPAVNLAILYFYCNINFGQFNDSVSVEKFGHLDLPETSLAESLIKEFAALSVNAFEKAISAYTLLDSNKTETTLPAVFKSKYTVVDLWASWCSPCRNENRNNMPSFIKKLTYLKDVDFLAISVDQDAAKWMKAVKEDKITWKNFLLKNEKKAPLPPIMNGKGIPYYLVYNLDGRAVYGSANSFEILNYLQKLKSASK